MTRNPNDDAEPGAGTALFRVRSDPTVHITVYDALRTQLGTAEGELALMLAPALYRVHLERAGEVDTDFVQHDGGETVWVYPGPKLHSPVPFAGAAPPSEAHRTAAELCSLKDTDQPLGPAPHTSRLFVFVRRVLDPRHAGGGDGAAQRDVGPRDRVSEPLRLYDGDGRWIDLWDGQTWSDTGERYFASARRAAPGIYQLRGARSRRTAVLPLLPGRAAHVFVTELDGGPGQPVTCERRVALVPAGAAFDAGSALWPVMEVMLAALQVPGRRLPVAARALLPGAVEQDLCFGIVAAYLLVRRMLQRPGSEAVAQAIRDATSQAAAEAIRNTEAEADGDARLLGALLERLAPYREIPDVAILGLIDAAMRTSGALPPPDHLTSPPLLRISLVLAMAYAEHAGRPIDARCALAQAARTRLNDPVWCTWTGRAWDERWIVPAVDTLRSHDPQRDAAAIARDLALPGATVADTLRQLAAALPAGDWWSTARAHLRRRGYDLLREVLGRGARSTVFLARRSADRRRLALKIIPIASGRGGCARALRALHRLGGPRHARRIGALRYGALPDGSAIWIATERCDGSLLDRVAESDAPLSPGYARQAIVDALEGLAALHAIGAVHGAIHPANLLVHGGQVALADPSVVTASALEASAGAALDEPRFAPPELLAGKATVKIAGDVWSMAATMYFLLTLDLPRDEYAEQTAREAARDNPTVPIAERRPELPSELARCIDRALSREPALRPEDANALRRQLLAAQLRHADCPQLLDKAFELYDNCFVPMPLKVSRLSYEPRRSFQCKQCVALWIASKAGDVLRIGLATGEPIQSWIGGDRAVATVYHQHDGTALNGDDAEPLPVLLIGRDDGALEIVADDHAWRASFYLDAWWQGGERHAAILVKRGVRDEDGDGVAYTRGITAISILPRPDSPGTLDILVATRRPWLYVIEASGGTIRLRERLAMPGWIQWIIEPHDGEPCITFIARSGDIVRRAQDQLHPHGVAHTTRLAALPTAALPFNAGALLLGTRQGLLFIDAAHPHGIVLPVTRSAVLCLDRETVKIGQDERDYVTMGLDNGSVRIVEAEVLRALAHGRKPAAGATGAGHAYHNFAKDLGSAVLAVETLRPAAGPGHAAYVIAALRDHRLRLYHVTSLPAVQAELATLWRAHIQRWFAADDLREPDARLAAELAIAAQLPPDDYADAWKYMLADVVLPELRRLAPLRGDADDDRIIELAGSVARGADRAVLQRLSAAMGELTALPADPGDPAPAAGRRPHRPHVGRLLALSCHILDAMPRRNDRAWLTFIENHLSDLNALARNTDPTMLPRLVAWTRFVRKYVLLGPTFDKAGGLEELVQLDYRTGNPLDALIYQARLAQRGYDVHWEYPVGEEVAALHVVTCPPGWGRARPIVVIVTASGGLALCDAEDDGAALWIRDASDDKHDPVTLLAPFNDEVQVRASAVVCGGEWIRIVIACTGTAARAPGLAIVELTSGLDAVHAHTTLQIDCDDASERVYAIEPLPGRPDHFVVGLETPRWPVGLLSLDAAGWTLSRAPTPAPIGGGHDDRPVQRASLAPGKTPTCALSAAATDPTQTSYLIAAGSDDGLVQAISLTLIDGAPRWSLRPWERLTHAITSIALRRLEPRAGFHDPDEGLFACYLGTAGGDTIALSILARAKRDAGRAVSPFGDYDALPLWRDTLEGAVLGVQLWNTPVLYGSNPVLAVATDAGRLCIYNHTRYPRKALETGDRPPQGPVSELENYYFRGMRFDRLALRDRLRALVMLDGGRRFVAAGPDGKVYLGECACLAESADSRDAREPLDPAEPLPRAKSVRLRHLFQRSDHDAWFHDAPAEPAKRDKLKLALCDLIHVDDGAVSSFVLSERLRSQERWQDCADLHDAVQQYLQRLDPENPGEAPKIKIVLKSLCRAFLGGHPDRLRSAIVDGSWQLEQRDKTAAVCQIVSDYLTRRLAYASPAAARLRITAIKELLRVPTLLHMAPDDDLGRRVRAAIETAVSACIRDDARLVRIEVMRALFVMLRNARIMADAAEAAGQRDRLIRTLFPAELGSLAWLVTLIVDGLQRLPAFTGRTALVSGAWFLIIALLPMFRIFPQHCLALCDCLIRADLGIEVVALCERALRGEAAAQIRSKIRHFYLLPMLDGDNSRNEYLPSYEFNRPGNRKLLADMGLDSTGPTGEPPAHHDWYALDDRAMAARLTARFHQLARMWSVTDKHDIAAVTSAVTTWIASDPAVDESTSIVAIDSSPRSEHGSALTALKHIVQELRAIAELSAEPGHTADALGRLGELGTLAEANGDDDPGMTAPICALVSGIVARWRDILAPPPQADQGKRFATYDLGVRLSEGGASDIYQIDAKRVIKVLKRYDDGPSLGGFINGMNFVKQLTDSPEHTPTIVPVTDVVKEYQGAPTYGYVMEWFPDGDLARYLTPDFHERKIAIAWAERVAAHIGYALQQFHSKNYCHSDVQPTNILVQVKGGEPLESETPLFLLNDFDRIVPLEPPPQSPRRGLSRSFGAIPAYLTSKCAADPRAARKWEDVVGLAMVIYQMLTGRTIDTRTHPREPIAQLERLASTNTLAGRLSAQRLIDTLKRVFGEAEVVMADEFLALVGASRFTA